MKESLEAQFSWLETSFTRISRFELSSAVCINVLWICVLDLCSQPKAVSTPSTGFHKALALFATSPCVHSSFISSCMHVSVHACSYINV